MIYGVVNIDLMYCNRSDPLTVTTFPLCASFISLYEYFPQNLFSPVLFYTTFNRLKICFDSMREPQNKVQIGDMKVLIATVFCFLWEAVCKTVNNNTRISVKLLLSFRYYSYVYIFSFFYKL